ncbi:MAG TPA: protein-methionine-sulfoxide reductase heme-binding subunit MsrQ [Anaerolineales bacterium]|nr:protein-methionine-sulfoxide reductase heme-binding subunit MsrQ [Anaerolineales bacterium]
MSSLSLERGLRGAHADEPRAGLASRLRELDWSRWVVHVGGWLPALWILALGVAGELTANPYQAVEQRTGRIALIFLMLSLACSPANLLLGWRQALRHRRTLGLYAFAYASLHLLILVGLDYGWSFRLLRADLETKPFIWVGAASILILASLAATSFVVWKRRLGRNWKRLHRLVYLAVPLVILHFAWARKANLATLSGDIALPLAFGAAALVLLALRMPAVRRWIAGRRHVISRGGGGEVVSPHPPDPLPLTLPPNFLSGD